MRSLGLGIALLATIGCDVSRPVRVLPDEGVDCPTLPPTLFVDTDCQARQCTVEVSQDGCKVTFEIRCAAAEAVTATVDRDGALAFPAQSQLGECAQATPVEGAALAFSCVEPSLSCTYQLFPPPIEPAVTIDRLPVVSALPMVPSGQLDQPLDQYTALTGYFAASLVTDRAVWVATRLGAFDDIECETAERTELVRIDPDSLGISSRGPGPDCLTALAAGTEGASFFGGSSGRRPRVYRFTGTGSVAGSADVPVPAGVDLDEQPLVVLALYPRADRLVVLLTTTDNPGDAWAITFDPQTLAHRATSMGTQSQLRSGLELEGRLYLADRRRGRVLVLDPADGLLHDSIALTSVRGVSDDAGLLYFHPPTRRLVVSTTGAKGALWVVDPADRSQQTVGVALAYERELVPWAMAPWPLDPDLIAVGATVKSPELTAYLALFSVNQLRFQQAAIALGMGSVRSLDVDGKGRLWAVMGWTGEVLRITPGG